MSSALEFDSARFRQVLGHFPTGVTIITGSTDSGPAGFTIGSFASISLDPPLVGFFPMLTSDTWQAIQPSGKFCVNVLAADQGPECWRFAKKGVDDRFEDVEWTASPLGSPILAKSIAWIDCSIENVQEVGDHLLVVGRVSAMSHAEDDPSPLLFYRGKLGEFSMLA